MEAVELTPESFPDFVRETRYAVIHVWAAWNGYDKEMRKLLKEVPPEIRAQIGFREMDVDADGNTQFLLEHGVRNVPALILYRDGIHMQTKHWRQAPDQVTAILRELLG